TYDSKASLMDYSARWYSPKVGRFTTEDTYAGAAYVPQTLNRYAYTLNNPVNYTDPTGHWCEYGEYSHGGDCDDPSHWVPDPVDNSGGSGGSSGGGSTGGDTGGESGGGDPSGGSSGGDSGGSYTPPPTPAEIAAGKYSQIFNSVGPASTRKAAHSSSGNTGKLLAAVMFYKPDGEIGRIEMNPLSGTPNNGSITDYMNSMGQNASFSNREQLAQRYGISDYSGTAAQNTALLNMLRSGTSGSYSSTSSFRPVNGNNVTEEDTPISISNRVDPESTPVTTTPASESILKKVGNFILGAGDGALSELTNGVMTSPSNDSASYTIGNSAGGFIAAFVTRKRSTASGGNTKTFVDQMDQLEAARYKRYWEQDINPYYKGEPNTRERTYTVPGTRSITDQKLSNTGELYERETIYDQFGRRIGNNDYTDHGAPHHHESPHHHPNPWQNPTQHGPNTPDLHPDTPR
ncbi:RHS repeat-associated core domain-containing protein, partial [Paenibacillus alginolyticus]